MIEDRDVNVLRLEYAAASWRRPKNSKEVVGHVVPDNPRGRPSVRSNEAHDVRREILAEDSGERCGSADDFQVRGVAERVESAVPSGGADGN